MPEIERPYPPLSLARRVCATIDGRDPIGAYDRLGAETRAAILEQLPDDWSFARKRVLDFGCGAGRTLRHFTAEAEQGEFWGADIDRPSVGWLQHHFSPPLHVLLNGPEPPLGLPYGTFDLVWALSVFTHLTDSSLPWILELHRLLRPGGLLIASYMGRDNSQVFTQEPWEEDRVGMNVLRAGQSWDDGGPVVLMSDWWIADHWGRAFEIVARAPVHGQTWALLRRREVELSVEELAEPADLRREYTAARHNLVQVERDHAAEMAALRRSYESSLSWRLTRPLRDAKRAMPRRRDAQRPK